MEWQASTILSLWSSWLLCFPNFLSTSSCLKLQFSLRSPVWLSWQWPSKITSDQGENKVASAPGCFSHLPPVWLSTFNLLIQYLVTLFRDSNEHSLAQGGDLNSVLTNFTHGLGKSPKPSGNPSWLFMLLPSSPLLDLLKVYSWEEFPQLLLQLSVRILILSPFQTHFWI